MGMTGKRRYRCVDCGGTQFESARTMTRRCRPRCLSCGSTFLEPDSDGAKELSLQIGTAKAIVAQHDRGHRRGESEPVRAGRRGAGENTKSGVIT